jgi:L-alanine-DL-glutamate epimerase-like enolase superfamily enzyme
MIGGMMETDLAMACSLQLCAALGGVDVCDLDTPFYLREQACNGSPWSEASAFLRVPTGAGVGLRPRSFGGQDIETIGIFPPSLTSRGQTGFQVD